MSRHVLPRTRRNDSAAMTKLSGRPDRQNQICQSQPSYKSYDHETQIAEEPLLVDSNQAAAMVTVLTVLLFEVLRRRICIGIRTMLSAFKDTHKTVVVSRITKSGTPRGP